MQTAAHTHAIRHRTKGPVPQGRKSGIARHPLRQEVPPDGMPGSGATRRRFCDRTGTEDCADSPAARVRGGTAGSSHSRTTRPYTQVRGAGGVSRRDGRQDQDMPSPTVHAGARPDGAAVDGTQKGRREPHTRGHQRCRNRYVAREGGARPPCRRMPGSLTTLSY